MGGIATVRSLIGRLGQFTDRLLPDAQQTPDSVRASRMLVRIGVSIAAVSSLMCVKYFSEGANLVGVVTIFGIAVQVGALIYHRRSARHRVSGHLFCFALWGLFFAIETETGGIHSPNLMANSVVVVLAPILVGRRGALYWLGAVLFTGLAQSYLTHRGWVGPLPEHGVALARAVELFATQTIVAAAAYFYESTKVRMKSELDEDKRCIDKINTDLRVILDNAGQGFLSLDREGRFIGERSAVVDAWLRRPAPQSLFRDALLDVDEQAGGWFQPGWDQLTAGFLPIELCLAQLPSQLKLGGKTITLEYRLAANISSDDEWQTLVVIMTDVTDRVAQESAQARQRDLLSAFDYILRDPVGFRTFLDSSRRHLDKMYAPSTTMSSLVRRLHTLKGNSAVVGLSRLAALCHELEDELDEGRFERHHLDKVNEELEAIETRLGFLSAPVDEEIQLSASEHYDILQKVRLGEPQHVVVQTILHWQQERVDHHLLRLARHAEQLAKRLDKGPLQVAVAHNNTRTDRRFAPIWEGLVHVVRNAVDHGIETPKVRQALGKGVARLHIEAHEEPGQSTIVIQDDGSGIPWEQIRQQAKARRLPCSSRADLEELLFQDGFSTRDEVTDTSGRGIGLSALRATCRKFGASLHIESISGHGTAISVTLPWEAPKRRSRQTKSLGPMLSSMPPASN